VSGSPRRAFRWTAYVLAVTAFGASIPTPIYPLYAARFGFSAAVLGLIFAGYTAGVLAALFLLAPRAEQWGRKPFLAGGMVFTAVAAGVFAAADSALWLAVGRILAGVGVGFTTSIATAAMTDLEPHRDQHHVARVAVAANFGGFAMGALASGAFLTWGPDPVQLVYLMPVVASVIGLLALREVPETASALGQPVHAWIQRIAVPARIRSSFWVAAGGIAACYAMYGFFAALVPSFIRSGLGISSPLTGGVVVSLMFGGAALIQLFSSQVRDRRALLVGFPVLIGATLALAGVLFLHSLLPILAVAPVLGIAVGVTYMGSATLVDRVASESERGEVLAGYYASGYLALAVPTIGVALASVVVGLTGAGELFGAILAAGVGLLYVVIVRTPTPAGGGGRPAA